MDRIRYREGYKYQLAEAYRVLTAVKPERFIKTTFLRLDTEGELYILEGYAWDGPSGPTVDTSDFMRGSLVHDALYQLMREGHLDPAIWRVVADGELVRICKEDGMPAFRRAYVYAGVRFGGGPNATGGDSPVIEAP